ncbi:MAG: hypothetical protein PHH85_14275 [Candidatus Methanoperedens sp.]|nr:hypothetical protein [Candidatus Methanoperedens sp.]
MKQKRKKPEVTCALCIEEGNTKTPFTGTHAQVRRHASTAHKGKTIGSGK